MDEFTIDGLRKALLGKTKQVASAKPTACATDIKDKKKSRTMGLGRLADPNLIFVRKFRWTLEGEGLPETWNTKVDIDFKKQELLIEMFEVVDTTKDDIDVHTWLAKDLTKESLVLKTYDGCGNELYQYEFKCLSMLEDKMGFDYAVSDPSARKVRLQYNNCIRKRLYEKVEKHPTLVGEFKQDRPLKKKYLFTAQVETTDGWITHEFVARPLARPNINIEEIETNFLGNKVWIPGKSTWEDMTLVMEKDVGRQFISNLSAVKDGNVLLHLLDLSQTKLETWKLNKAGIRSFKEVEDKDGDRYEIVVKYENVQYENHKQERKHECRSC